jgi:hypothetical protein
MLPLTALIRAGLSDGMRSNSEPLAISSFERIGAQANEIERQAGSRKKISRVLFEKSARGRIIRIPRSLLSLPFCLGSFPSVWVVDEPDSNKKYHFNNM